MATQASEPAAGARTFLTSGEAYDAFMGRYSRPLSGAFADAAGVVAGTRVLDVGCGPGALTTELVRRLGPGSVAACDPSAPFVAECAARHPGVDVREGRAEALPFDDDTFDVVLSQLVLHFVDDPEAAAAEARRVLRPGGTAAACVWDFADGMQLLRFFWDAALTVDGDAPDDARTLPFGREGEIADLLDAAGFTAVRESALTVSSTYSGVDELWSGFMAGIGPVGAYLLSQPEESRVAIRAALEQRIGSPRGPFTLEAVAHAASGRLPG